MTTDRNTLIHEGTTYTYKSEHGGWRIATPVVLLDFLPLAFAHVRDADSTHRPLLSRSPVSSEPVGEVRLTPAGVSTVRRG